MILFLLTKCKVTILCNYPTTNFTSTCHLSKFPRTIGCELTSKITNIIDDRKGGRLAERNGNRRCLGTDEDACLVVSPGSNLLSAIVAVMTSRVHCSHTLLGFRLRLLCKRRPYRLRRGRGHNEGNAAAKLVFDTDCGGIDGNEPLGEALNVSMANPLLVQPRKTRRDRDLYTFSPRWASSSFLDYIHPFFVPRRGLQVAGVEIFC